jgi:Flp pilus assembly protein TadG
LRGFCRSTELGRDPRLPRRARRAEAEGGLSPSWLARSAKVAARAARDQSGQSVVEFGLVVPLLCALVLVLVNFGKAMNYWIDLTHVANQIARQAAVNATTLRTTAEQCAQLETNELRSGSKAVDASSIQITTSRTYGDPVTVTVSTKYHWIPYFGGGTWTIKGKATMRLEHDLDAAWSLSGTCT